MRRWFELDALRGFLLVWMVLAHLPTSLTVYTNQPFGFISAAEGFILISGLLSGRNYLRLADRHGVGRMQRKVKKRGWKLYLYHILIMGVALGLAAPVAAGSGMPGVSNLLHFVYQAPTRAVVYAALLVYTPALLDILPIYIFFSVALTPLALRVGEKFGWKYVVGASFSVWLAAQFGFKRVLYGEIFHLLPRVPLKSVGAFDLWAWQFLWVIGLWLGARWARGKLPAVAWAKKLIVPAIVVAAGACAYRYALLPNVEPGTLGMLFNSWHLGAVRLIDVAAVAVVLIRFRKVIRAAAVRPLVEMGEASLQVFCVHLLFCFGALMIMGQAPVVTGWTEAIFVVATIAGMLLTAKIIARSQAQRKAAAATPAGAKPTTARSGVSPGIAPAGVPAPLQSKDAGRNLPDTATQALRDPRLNNWGTQDVEETTGNR